MTRNLSYLMGAENITDAELRGLGVEIADRTADGDRMLVISDAALSGYITFIKTKLAEGFWNEIIGEREIRFIFKFKGGAIKEYTLSPQNEKEINDLCIEFNHEPPDLAPNVYKYISENKFYHDFMVEHYADMIDRKL